MLRHDKYSTLCKCTFILLTKLFFSLIIVFKDKFFHISSSFIQLKNSSTCLAQLYLLKILLFSESYLFFKKQNLGSLSSDIFKILIIKFSHHILVYSPVNLAISYGIHFQEVSYTSGGSRI